MVDTVQLEQKCHEDYVAAKNNLKKTIDADYAKYHLAQMKRQSELQELYKNYQIAKKEAIQKYLRQPVAISPKPLSEEQKKWSEEDKDREATKKKKLNKRTKNSYL